MNDDFEETYEEDDGDLLGDAKDAYDQIQDTKDKIKDIKDKVQEKRNSNNASKQQSDAREFDKALRNKNIARTENPELANKVGGEAAKNLGEAAGKKASKDLAKQATKEVAKKATQEAAKVAAKTAATTAATTATTATAVGGAVAAQAAIPVVGWIALAIEAAIAATIAITKAIDKKAAESGVDTKGMRRLLMISPIVLPIALIMLIILLLTQTETYDKVEFMQEAVKCLESDKGCIDFMNTRVIITPTNGSLIKATDIELATFVVEYTIAENIYFGAQGSSFLEMVGDINTIAKEGLDEASKKSTVEKIFQELIDKTIIGDIRYAWNLFKWLRLEKKVFNNIDWYIAYTESTFSYSATVQAGKAWLETKVSGAPNIGGDTLTRTTLSVPKPSLTRAWLKSPLQISTDDAISAVSGYIPSYIELYATYVGTGDYGLTNDIYKYYVSDDYKLEVTLYELTTVISKEKIDGDKETKYTVTYEKNGKEVTEEMTKKEYDKAIEDGEQGALAWLGDKLKDFASSVKELADKLWDEIKEILGFYITAESNYVPIVTKGNAFNYKINQNYKIKTEKVEEPLKKNAEKPYSKSKTKSDFTYVVKTTTTETKEEVIEGEYEYKEDSNGLYAKVYGEDSYFKVRESASETISYYKKKSFRGNDTYSGSSEGGYVKEVGGSFKYVRNDTNEIKTYSEKPKTKKTTTTKTTETEKKATFKVTTKIPVHHKITTWTNKLEYVATNITEYDEINRYAQVFVDMVEKEGHKYTIDDVAIALEVIDAYYSEDYKSSGSSIDYSALPDGKFGWPVPANKVVSALFGYTTWYGDDHGGIDIWAVDTAGNLTSSFSYAKTVDIVAAQDGTVILSKDAGCADGNRVSQSCGGGYGNYVKIQHENNYVTVYAHLSPGTIVVKQGDKVKAGQYLGKMGSSGNSSGTHLHYEIQFGGQRIDPLSQYDVEPYNYKVPYSQRNNAAITMANPYKVNFSVSSI